jgi:hypothetical protein
MANPFNERLPDREGYLGFQAALDNDNEALARRAGASWWAEERPKSELACYYDLYLTQVFIERQFSEPQHKSVTNAYARASAIKNAELRNKVTNCVQRLARAFQRSRMRQDLNHGELSVARYPIKDQLAKNPAQTESQAWFAVKRDLDTRHLAYLNHLQKRFERAVDSQIGRAHGATAKMRANDAIDRARRAAATYRTREPQTDKGRELDR